MEQIKSGETLANMFELQKAVMEHYISIEDLPRYPMDLMIRTNQEKLKDFTYRIIEEMGECYQDMIIAYAHCTMNKPNESQVNIETFNEEIADVWHFMLEIMIFSGIEQAEIMQWMSDKVQENESLEAILRTLNPLGSLLIYAQFLNDQDDKSYPKSMVDAYNVFKDDPDKPIRNPQLQGGRKLSDNIIETTAGFFWSYTHSLTLAMNCLKSRKWHTQDKVVNEILYKARIVESFVMLLRIMVYLGKGELSIFNSYYLKNLINQERIKTNY